MDKIIKILHRRLAEHTIEAETIFSEMETKRDKAKASKQHETIKELIILKDQIIFHKACITLIQDLLEEITK